MGGEPKVGGERRQLDSEVRGSTGVGARRRAVPRRAEPASDARGPTGHICGTPHGASRAHRLRGRCGKRAEGRGGVAGARGGGGIFFAKSGRFCKLTTYLAFPEN